MFNFFDSMVEFFGNIINWLVGIVETVVTAIDMIVSGVAFLHESVNALPPFCVVAFSAIIAVSILSLVVGSFIHFK